MKQESRLNKFDRLMMMVTFAEAGEHETALMMAKEAEKQQQKVVSKVEERPNQRPTLHL